MKTLVIMFLLLCIALSTKPCKVAETQFYEFKPFTIKPRIQYYEFKKPFTIRGGNNEQGPEI